MTVRSVVLGLLGAIAICAVTYLNDHVLRQTHLVGNHMPFAVYGLLIVFLLLLHRRWRALALTGSEIAVIMAMVLASCAIPGSGLMRTFTASLILPHHYERTNPGWRKHRLLEQVPDKMLADVSGKDDEVLGGYLQGLSEGTGHAAIGDVPWQGWTGTLLFWIPLIITLFLALLSLSVVLHRQWSQHEHLPYPVAAFTDAMLPDASDGQNRVASVFRNRSFWVAVGVVVAIHSCNYLARWFPQYVIPITLRLDLVPLQQILGLRGVSVGNMFRPTIYFTIIGIAFLIPADLSAGFGIGPYLWAGVVAVFAGYGLNLNSPVAGTEYYTGLTPRSFLLFGSCTGVFLSLLYTGRHHYASTFRHAFRLRPNGKADVAAVWGLRAFGLLSLLFVVQLALAGISWPLACLYLLLLVICHTVMGRVIAEGGVFHFQINAFPCMVLWGLLGVSTVGPTVLLLMQIATMVMIIDPREALMPFVVNANKLLELRGAPLGRTALAAGAALVVGLAVAVPVTLYIQYDRPQSLQRDRWGYERVPKMPFDNALQVRQRLVATGESETLESLSAWERITSIRPNGVCTIALVAGLGLVLICAAGRLRFSGWPLHPLLFVLWTTWHARHFAFTFLLGWGIKYAIMRYGGTGLYGRVKPVMFGLIAGEILGAMLPNVVGLVYYLATGDNPVAFHVFPG